MIAYEISTKDYVDLSIQLRFLRIIRIFTLCFTIWYTYITLLCVRRSNR